MSYQPAAAGKRDKLLTIPLDAGELRAVRNASKAMGLPMTVAVRLALREWLRADVGD
jgi:hypothetical protein